MGQKVKASRSVQTVVVDKEAAVKAAAQVDTVRQGGGAACVQELQSVAQAIGSASGDWQSAV